MPSIHPNYEYDIFISYRQNDNKRDKWVTQFVEALKDELEATLKNPVSIYFDENPHDGLLETHDVDRSLEKKLKCLIFIPIISQTYCDPNCFAWEHELLPFIEFANKDELGMNITLANGNVASRILPIRIHDIDKEDTSLFESVIDGKLRPIDFIYKTKGVNRPLKPIIDDVNTNEYHTVYRDQINKVANALKDIGTSVLNQTDDRISVQVAKHKESEEIKTTKKNGIYMALASIVIALLFYWGYQQFYISTPVEVEDITIAVLAFDDQSPNGDQEWLGDGMADEILNVLAKVNGIQVTGKTSSFSFKGKGLTTKEIGENLKVKTVLEGSVIKIGNKLRITAQLIDVETDTHIWSKKYDRNYADVFTIMDEVAQSIAGALKSELSIVDLKGIKVGYTVNPYAYEYYLKGLYLFYNKYISSYSDDVFKRTENMFLKAILIDSTFADAYADLADLYDSKYPSSNEFDVKRDSAISIAYTIDPNSLSVLRFKGSKFTHINTLNLDSAFYYYKKAYLIEPGNIITNNAIGWLYHQIGLYENCIDFGTIILAKDPLNMDLNLRMYIASISNGDLLSAKKYIKTVLDLDNTSSRAYHMMLILALFYDNDIDEARSIYQKMQELFPEQNALGYAYILAKEGKKNEALEANPNPNNNHTLLLLYSLLEMKTEALMLIDEKYSYSILLNSRVIDFIREEPVFKEHMEIARIIQEERMEKYGHYFDE